jgi:hypothetical protein
MAREWPLHDPMTDHARFRPAPTQADLIAQCRAAQAAGLDFPTLWNEVLKVHPLVIGPPVQTVRDGRIRMEVRLITGGVVAFDTDTNMILPD